MLLHVTLLFVLLMQFSGHITNLHGSVMAAKPVGEHSGSGQSRHDDAGMPPHEHRSMCVLAGMCMLVGDHPDGVSGIVSMGTIVLPTPHLWQSLLRVPTPPPK